MQSQLNLHVLMLGMVSVKPEGALEQSLDLESKGPSKK